ncbi:MAG: HAD family hydrolase [Chitinophagaceae bacterium]
MPVKNIIFDLGGVILNIDLRKTQDAFTALGVKNIDEVFRMGHIDSFFKSYETGAIDDAAFIASVQNLAGIKLAPEIVIEAWNALLIDFPPERINFLKKIRSKYRLFLLSNTSALHHTRFQDLFKQEFGGSLDDLFDKAYYSHIIKLHKPDTASYNLIIDENRLDAGKTLFIDDSAANVEGAERAGLKGIHLAPGKTILELGL